MSSTKYNDLCTTPKTTVYRNFEKHRDRSCSWIGNIVKMPFLPTVIHESIIFSIKIFQVCCVNAKPNLNEYRNAKVHVSNMLLKKKQGERMSLQDVKIFYRAPVSKTLWHWWKTTDGTEARQSLLHRCVAGEGPRWPCRATSISQ